MKNDKIDTRKDRLIILYESGRVSVHLDTAHQPLYETKSILKALDFCNGFMRGRKHEMEIEIRQVGTLFPMTSAYNVGTKKAGLPNPGKISTGLPIM